MASKRYLRKNMGLSVIDEQTLRLMFEGHSAVMLLIDPETGAILDANRAALDFYGYSKAEICGMSIEEINTLPPELVAEERQKALSEERNYFIFRHKLAGGEERVVEVHSSPITLQGKQLLFSIIHDITERKRAEDNLRRRTDELTSLQTTILDISSPHSLPELLKLIVERAANLLDASSGGLYLTEPEQRKVRCVVSYKTQSDFTGILLDFGVGAAGYVAETGQPLIIDDYRKWTGRATVYEEQQPFQAVMSAPMLWQGKVSGVIHLLREDISKKFTPEELNLLLLFANHAAVAVENARLFNLFDQELTERRQAENLLERTHKNYETFFNSIDDFLFVLDEQGNIIHTNKTVTDRLKYSEADLLGQSVLMVHPPERREEAGRIVGEMLAGTAEFCPVPLITKSGQRIPVETRVTPGFWNDKPAIFGVTKDMSQVKLSEEKFSKAFQSNSMLMALSRFEDGTYLDVNEVFLKTLGFTREEVIGRRSTQLGIFTEPDQRNRIIEEIKQNGTVKDLEVVVQTKDGFLRDGLFSADPIYIGKDLCLLTVMVDITERKRVDVALRESEEKLRSIVEFATDGIAMTDERGLVAEWNPAQSQIVGLARAEAIGQPLWDIQFQSAPIERQTPALYEKIKAFFQDVLASGKIPENLQEREVLIRNSSGIARVIRSATFSIKTARGFRLASISRDITEYKQAEEALRENQSFYHSLVEVSPLSICRKDLDGRFTFANRRFLEVSHITLGDLVGKTDFDLHPRELAEKYRRDDRKIIESGQVQELVEEHSILGGEITVVQSIKTPIYDGTGKVNGIQISFWDITERRKAEKALKESEERLREVLENSLDASYKRDLRTNTYDYFSPVSERIFGYTQDEMKTLPLDIALALIHPEDASETQRVLAEAISGFADSAYKTEYRFKHKDGQYRWLRDQFRVMRDEQGHPIALIGSVGDITERKLIEKALRESEEKYRTVANFTYDWEAWHAPDGTCLYISPSCERISGYKPEQFLSDPNLIIKITHPDDRARVTEHFDLVTHHCMGEDAQLDFRLITPAGEMRWISHHCTAVYGANGQCLGRRESNRDITKRKVVEHELQSQRDFANQILNTMGQGLTVTDVDGRFEFVNPAYARLFGCDAADLIGKYPRDVTAPDDRAFLEEQKALRHAGKSSTYESRLLRLDGSISNVLITGVPRERDGQYAGAIAVITDLTEQKRVEDELRHARNALEQINHKLEQVLAREQHLARTDTLTGVNNRGHLFELASRKFNVALRYRLQFSLILLDIDHFKQINDTFGHAVGDQVLQRIIQVVCDQIRSADVIGRYGGDEFVILLPQSNAQDALILADRIHASIADTRIETSNGTITLTFSIGISQVIHRAPRGTVSKTDTVEDLFLRADQALYAAKQAGRNRTVIFDSE